MAVRVTNPAASAAASPVPATPTAPVASAAPVSYEFLATCAKGAEAVLSRELRELVAAGGAGDGTGNGTGGGFAPEMQPPHRPRKKPLKIRPLTAGVAFFGSLEDAYRALLYLSVASRVLLILERVDAIDADTLYAAVRALPWEQHLSATGTIAVDARGTNDQLRDERFMALKVKDAICDRLVELFGVRPSVKRERPDVRVNVALRGTRATIALDLAGEPLHRRGYRVPSSAIVAPLRETLAATMLRAAGWGWEATEQQGQAVSRAGQSDGSPYLPRLLDPLCGSGTIVIEAALMELGRPCGLLRDYWGFEGWLGHDATLWESLIDAADEQVEQTAKALLRQRREAGLGVRIFASDVDPAAVAVARESAKRAGVADFIHFAVADVAVLDKMDKKGTAPLLSHGLLVTNPPYGERLATSSQLPALYAALGKLQANAAGTLTVVAITPDDRINAYLGGTPAQRIDTFNGSLETAIRLWPVRQEKRPLVSADLVLDVRQGDVSLVSSPFANRLHKMATHRGKWARRSGVSCYRVYDADLPDYAVAIDLYQGAAGTPSEGQCWLHISEYEPPTIIDPQKAADRLVTVLSIAPELLAVPTSNVFLKQRRHSKGGEQYAPTPASRSNPSSLSTPQSPPSAIHAARATRAAHTTRVATASPPHLIEEGGHRFEVDFARYLDTGIFLDHRMTRQLLQERAAGADCLNLFAYTGTASVYMAAGDARSVTTVDLSKTYLDWAQRNMRLNCLTSKHYQFVQADALKWVQEMRHNAEKYGLIFADPPTFSNSARMGSRTWDVQRDHAELLIALSRMLTPDGVAVFSCNRRDFKPDVALLKRAKVRIEDITARTIPPDFERNRKIHHCYLVTKAT